MAEPGKNSTAEYRTLVEGLLRGLDQLRELTSVIWDKTEEAFRRHPDYRVHQFGLHMNPLKPPLMSKGLKEVQDKNDWIIQEFMPQIRKTYDEVLALAPKVKALQDHVGPDFCKISTESSGISFYQFAEMLDLVCFKKLNVKIMTWDLKDKPFTITTDEIVALDQKWADLQPLFNRFEGLVNAKPAKPRSGRLKKEQSNLLRERMIQFLRLTPGLKDDPGTLATLAETSLSTADRFLKDLASGILDGGKNE